MRSTAALPRRRHAGGRAQTAPLLLLLLALLAAAVTGSAAIRRGRRDGLEGPLTGADVAGGPQLSTVVDGAGAVGVDGSGELVVATVGGGLLPGDGAAGGGPDGGVVAPDGAAGRRL